VTCDRFSYIMSVRPVLLKDLKRSAVHNHRINLGKDDYNRFSPLTQRPRIHSTGKRPRSEDLDSSQAPKTPRLDSSMIFSQLSNQETALKTVKTLATELETLNAREDLPKDPRLDCISKIILELVKSNETLASVVLDSVSLSNQNAKKPGNNIPSFSQVASKPVPPRVEVSSEETQRRKVKNALREAEKKTLIFNLNLGSSQMMNKDSISRKVTTTLGQIVKDGDHDFNVQDAEDVIDDILSCAKLEFLGNATKKFYNNKNPQDSRNDKMYTIPVRLDFKDKDTRFNAETSLRKICKISCSTPYPKRLRAMLTDMVKTGKALHPNKFIRTKVNVDQLTIEAHAKTENGWLDLNLKRDIPLNILDNNPLTPVASQASNDDTEDEEISLS
jgi:hypothetical protein